MTRRKSVCEKKKRHRSAEQQGLSSIGLLQSIIDNLQQRVRQLFSPTMPKTMFDMSAAGGRQELIDWLWAGEYAGSDTDLLEMNENLEQDLQAWTTSTYQRAHQDEYHLHQRRSRLNYLANLIARNRNKNMMPSEHVLLGLEAKHTMINDRFWDKLTTRRVLPSRRWVDNLVESALAHNPGCPYEVVDWCTAAVADNYTEQSNYKALHTMDSKGVVLNMTNWASLALASNLVAEHHIAALGRENALENMFKAGFDKFEVVELCHPEHPELLANRLNRWRAAFDAIKAGTYFHRSLDYVPAQAHHLHYHDTIRERLQSSYEDVEEELTVMRTHARHKHSKFMFVGGDGLLINRINHTLARNPNKWLRRAPAIIPVQGEHPHGTCHILHMGWRPYQPLLVPILAAVGHDECRADFLVSEYNLYDFAICILIEGIAQYFIHLEDAGGERSMPPLHHPKRLMRAAKDNIDLMWLLHFLHDFGFLYWQFRQAVRSNKSAEIDLVTQPPSLA